VPNGPRREGSFGRCLPRGCLRHSSAGRVRRQLSCPSCALSPRERALPEVSAESPVEVRDVAETRIERDVDPFAPPVAGREASSRSRARSTY
jgi:hypothetical protein